MKKFNPNSLNPKHQNGRKNPRFFISKEFAPNGADWFDSDDSEDDSEDD